MSGLEAENEGCVCVWVGLSPLTLSRSPRRACSPCHHGLTSQVSSVKGEVSLVTVLSRLKTDLLEFAFVAFTDMQSLSSGVEK